MSLRIGFLGVAHMHAWSYVSSLQKCMDARPAAVWDSEAKRKDIFALENGLQQAETAEELLDRSDAVIVCSTNTTHVQFVAAAADAGKPILCEKPLVAHRKDIDEMRAAVNGKSRLMTAFPCRFAPSYVRLKERVKSGDIGAIQAICATNRGRCPFDWFVDIEQSGGGAMIDHTVHVADLLRDLLNQDPTTVQAQTGNNMYGQDWEDTAMVTVEYPSGVFATIDSSWSRTKNYKTWGDVAMNVVGAKGVIELNMFGLSVDVWTDGHATHGYGSNIDDGLISEWISSIQEDRDPLVTLEDGLAASRVAIAAYESAKRREAVSAAV